MVGLLRQKTKNRLVIYDPRQKWFFCINGIMQRRCNPHKVNLELPYVLFLFSISQHFFSSETIRLKKNG
jgi:hypothetical protein